MFPKKLGSAILLVNVVFGMVLYPALTAWGYFNKAAVKTEISRTVASKPVKMKEISVSSTYTVEQTSQTANYQKPVYQKAVYSEKNSNNSSSYNNQLYVLARIIDAEAGGEPYLGKVAVGAVLLNRIRSGKFPQSLAANIFKGGEFESVSNGYIWEVPVSSASYRAAKAALNGWDPTYGALYFYNPAKSSSSWIWSRQVILRIGDHVFAR